MRRAVSACFAAAIVCAAYAAPPPANPLIDYGGFAALTDEVQAYRAARLVSLDEFKRMAAEEGTLVLDARSADAYASGHIEGAVNLPFTDFTAAKLQIMIGDPNRRILIYCNNNFTNDVEPVPTKAVQLALNIQTFVNLYGYGFRNVYELGEAVDLADPRVGWVKG